MRRIKELNDSETNDEFLEGWYLLNRGLTIIDDVSEDSEVAKRIGQMDTIVQELETYLDTEYLGWSEGVEKFDDYYRGKGKYA